MDVPETREGILQRLCFAEESKCAYLFCIYYVFTIHTEYGPFDTSVFCANAINKGVCCIYIVLFLMTVKRD